MIAMSSEQDYPVTAKFLNGLIVIFCLGGTALFSIGPSPT
jgi:hypothetical protein